MTYQSPPFDLITSECTHVETALNRSPTRLARCAKGLKAGLTPTPYRKITDITIRQEALSLRRSDLNMDSETGWGKTDVP